MSHHSNFEDFLIFGLLTGMFDDDESDGCYIATAVYGSYDCSEVWTLRRFRDYTLKASTLGRVLIRFYYAISPTLVGVFGRSRLWNAFWRGALDRFVRYLRKRGVEDTAYEDADWRKDRR